MGVQNLGISCVNWVNQALDMLGTTYIQARTNGFKDCGKGGTNVVLRAWIVIGPTQIQPWTNGCSGCQRVVVLVDQPWTSIGTTLVTNVGPIRFRCFRKGPDPTLATNVVPRAGGCLVHRWANVLLFAGYRFWIYWKKRYFHFRFHFRFRDRHLELRTQSEIGRHPELQMSVTKPEVKITFERKELLKRFQRLPHIFDHVLPEYDTADIGRPRKPKIGTQNQLWFRICPKKIYEAA